MVCAYQFHYLVMGGVAPIIKMIVKHTGYPRMSQYVCISLLKKDWCQKLKASSIEIEDKGIKESSQSNYSFNHGQKRRPLRLHFHIQKTICLDFWWSMSLSVPLYMWAGGEIKNNFWWDTFFHTLRRQERESNSMQLQFPCSPDSKSYSHVPQKNSYYLQLQ